ncbi:MAG: nucleotidyltransferase family protein [Segatella copri]
MEKLYFEFLQVAIGNRKSLSAAINDSDWLRLFNFCKKQALIGVGFSAVEKLHAQGAVCPANLRMQWMTLALQIEKRNALLNEQCKKLTEQYVHDGLSTCILKGQGNCLNYPEELKKRRQCGDIDIWATTINEL